MRLSDWEQGAGLWRPPELIALYASTGVASGMVAASWIGVADATTVADQVRWLNLSVVGAVVAGLSNVLFLVLGRRRVGQRRGRLLPEPVDVELVTDDATLATDRRLVLASGMTHFHRSTCQLVANKDVSADGAEAHELAGRRPCAVCGP